MSNNKSIMEMKEWKRNALVIGVVAGALVGFGAAYLFTQNADDYHRPKFTPGDGVKLGLLVLGVLRAIADLGSE